MWRDGTDGLFHKPDLTRSKREQGDYHNGFPEPYRTPSLLEPYRRMEPWQVVMWITLLVLLLVVLVGCAKPPYGTVTHKSPCCHRMRVEGVGYVPVSDEDYSRNIGWNWFEIHPVESSLKPTDKPRIPEDPPKNVYPSGYTPESPR